MRQYLEICIHINITTNGNPRLALKHRFSRSQRISKMQRITNSHATQ